MWNILLISFLITLVIQFVFALFAIIKKTDKVTDLSYGLTFIILAWVLFIFFSEQNATHLITTIMVTLWGARLAIYLFIRILKIGKDERFDDRRGNPIRFASFWVLQLFSIWIISFSYSIPMGIIIAEKLSFVSGLGIFLWIIGLVIETIADYQKYTFKNKPENKNLWIESGVWKYSRHPNYFGEIMLWWGVYLFSTPFLSGIEHISIIGPLFITALILFVSGVPLLEKKYDEKYKDNEDYQKYKQTTGLVVPFFCR